MSIGETVSRPLGPLPLWGWAVALGGTVLIFRATRKGGTTTPQPIGGSGSGSSGSGGSGADGADGTDGTDGTQGDQGPKGDPGAAGAPGTFPVGYTKIINDIFNWMQEFNRSQNYKDYLRAKIDAGNLNATDLAKAEHDLAALNGSGQKFTATYGGYRGHTFYGLSWINTTINSLQAQLGKL